MPRKKVVQEVVEAPSTECEEKTCKEKITSQEEKFEPEFVSTTDIKLDQEEFTIPPSILSLFEDISDLDITISCIQWEIKAHLKIN